MGERESSRKCTPRLDPTSLRNRIRRLFPSTCATICRLQVGLEVIKPFLLHNSSEQPVHSLVFTMVRNALTSGPDSCETCLSSSCLHNLGDLYAESGQTLQGSFSAVSNLSMPKFASKYSLESSRRDLHNALHSFAPYSNLKNFAKIC